MRNLGNACLIVSVLSACAITGPRSISSGRLDYNEAIATTSSQQMLMAVVNSRYGHSASLLTVASITANLRMTAGSAIEIGVGDSSTYEGNLVPLSLAATYEENPTISYVPVAGEQYLSYLTMPIRIRSLA